LGSGWSGFGLGSIPQPLFQQEGSGCAVEPSTAVAVEPMGLAGLPAAGVFIHPGQRQGVAGIAQGLLQLQAIAAAMQGLSRWLLVAVQRQAYHQQLHPPFQHQGQEPGEVGGEIAAGHGLQGCHGDAERITAGQTDPPSAYIEGQGRSGAGPGHSGLDERGWHAAAAGLEAGLELLEHRTDALGRPPDGR